MRLFLCLGQAIKSLGESCLRHSKFVEQDEQTRWGKFPHNFFFFEGFPKLSGYSGRKAWQLNTIQTKSTHGIVEFCSTFFEWRRHESPKLLIACPKSVLKRIIILGRIEYRILFVWWKLNESNIEYYSLIKKIFEYYSNTLKYSNIRIYSNKFAQNCKFSGSLKFSKPENMF